MAKKKEPTYQQALNEIEDIVNQLESESVDVDDLTKLTKRASELVNYCRKKLKSTEEELKANIE